ncbi:MAG: xylulokinase [Myxococcales bacterium]|nr:xylulokinase [Myxococcales bacterium]
MTRRAKGVLLGIDIGTTGVRAAVFAEDGTLVADASVACPHEAPHVGWAEADPDAWWRSVVRVLGELGLTTKLADIAGVAVVGQAPTVVLVDDAGAVVRPAILWLDTRADAEARELGTEAYYLGPKLLWLARNEPEALARTKWMLQSHSFVAQRLTGEVAVDPSTAALALPLFDLATLTWVQDAFIRVHDASTGAGLIAAQMPPLRKAHEVLGTVTAEAASATGLRAGTPVVVGGGDFAAATLGAGVIEEGEACLMLGTAGNLLVPRSSPGADARLINAHHVGTDSWLSLGGTLSGGAQEWLRHALARGSLVNDDTAVRGALPTFEVLDGEAARVPAASDGLLFLPYLQGERTPIWDVSARGAYVGLGLNHGRGHLWRSLLEGIALGFVDCQAVLEDGGVVLREVIAANGGGKSALFRQILCDALGVPLAYAAKGAGTVAGAAILAGLGAGVLAKPEDARAWRGALVRHEPNAAAHTRYRELLELRRATYAGLRGVFEGLANLRDS